MIRREPRTRRSFAAKSQAHHPAAKRKDIDVMLIWILILVAIIVVAVAILGAMRKQKQKPDNVPTCVIEKLPNGNERINGNEYLSRKVSHALDEAGDKEDPRFIGSKEW